MVEGLAANGVPAAVVGATGRLRVANDLFGSWFEGDIIDLHGQLHFRDASANRQLRAALSPDLIRDGGRSFPVSASERLGVLHCVPIRGRSRDRLESDGFVIILAQPGNRMIPGADLLRLLYDLTPAEARLARLLAAGNTVAAAAGELGVQANTARIQLKGIYAKTGFSRQSDFLVALAAMAGPQSGS